MKQARVSGRVRDYCIFGVQPEGKSPLRRPRHRWKDNIKMDFKEIVMGGMDCFRIAQGRDKWMALINVVSTFKFYNMSGIY